MLTRALPSDEPDDRCAAVDCTMLDAGAVPLEARELRRVICAILDGAVDEIARDRNAICYRVRLAAADGTPLSAIVKIPRMGPQRTNTDATFGGEAKILAALPAAGIAGAPALLGRVAAGDLHCLIMADVPGSHPHARESPLDARGLAAILDRLFAMDARGLMHYDLKSANILLDGAQAAFVDFEFARFRDWAETYSPSGAAHCADFNVSCNPSFPMRTNVANFEFRTLHHYLDDLERFDPGSARRVHHSWLRGKSAYHRRMQAFVETVGAAVVARMADAGALTSGDVRKRLGEAARHEALLAGLFARPPASVVAIERALMAYRCAMFERKAEEAARLRSSLLDALGAADESLPAGYREAVARVVELAGRSVHPGA